jgi:hypothetical protein
MRYSFSNGKGHYELNHFPGNNQIVVSNHSFLKPEFRGNGYGKELGMEKIELAKELGFDYMIATVVIDNGPQMKIMHDNGWKWFDSFHNSVTGNDVSIWGRRLDDREEEERIQNATKSRYRKEAAEGDEPL